MLEIDILRNSTQTILGVLRVAFYGFGCPKRHPDALLAKTMDYYRVYLISSMYFVPCFGHAKVYETSIWTPCFQISAKTLALGIAFLDRHFLKILAKIMAAMQHYSISTAY